MTENICYKKNFLSNVVARVDFPSPIQGLEKQLPPEISKKVMDIFPIAEPRKAIAQELRISPDELKQKRSEIMEWRFHGKDRDKTLTIIPAAVFVEYTVYKSYEVLKNDFLEVLSAFFGTFRDALGSRLGRRRFKSQGSPMPRCSTSECGRYWVSTAMRYRSELTAFESAKSMMRYLAKGTAGLVRFSPRMLKRLPSPPARIKVNTLVAFPP